MAVGSAQAALVGKWIGADFTTGTTTWTSTPDTGSKVATLVVPANATPPDSRITAGVLNGKKAIAMAGGNGGAYFTVAQADNPIGNATALTLVAVFYPEAQGNSNGWWWAASGLIGMEIGAGGDWGLGWQGNQVVGGTGAPDRNLLSGFHDVLQPIVAVFTWSNTGIQRLYVNGILASESFTSGTNNRASEAFALGAMTSGGGTPFTGTIAELQIYNSDESANIASITDPLMKNYFGGVTVQSSRLLDNGGEIVLIDGDTDAGTGAAAQTNPAGSFSLNIDGTVLPVTATKTGRLTSLKFTGTFVPNTTLSMDLTVPLASGATQSFLANQIPVGKLPTTLPSKPGAVNSWGIREYPGSTANNIQTSLDLLANATDPSSYVEGTAPVFNHADPDSDNNHATGNFNNELPILSNVADQDDNFAVVGRTQITVPAAGDYTFAIHSDDGFVMRVSSATGTGRFFMATQGSGQIDQADDQVIFLDGGTGDSNTHATYHFDAAGTYDILYLGWDGGGGGFYEVAWAPGLFDEDRQTNLWTLVGNPSDPSFVTVPFRDRFIPSLPGPAGTAGNFGVRSYLNAGTVDGIGYGNTFLRDTTRVPDGTETVDAQVPTLNAHDPQSGDFFGFPGDRDFPGNTSADDNNVITTAHGRINITTAGTYTFWFQGDDGFMLRIKGVDGHPNPSWKWATQGNYDGNGTFQMSHPNELFFNANGNPNTRGIIDLAVGSYDLELLHVELTGGFGYELSAAAGSWPHNTTPPNGFQLVGVAQPGNAVPIPGIADPGWTVQSSTAGDTTFNDGINGAEARINATINGANPPANSTKLYDFLDFYDPENGSQGSFTGSNPWPLNTPADDDHYAMRATGILNITEAGAYHLGFQGDDGGYLYIYGQGGTSDPTITSIVQTKVPAAATLVTAPNSTTPGVINGVKADTPTGDSKTIVSVNLAVGQYRLQTLSFEGGSGSWWEVIGSKATDPSFNYPLLRKGAGSSVPFLSGLPLVAQSVTPPTGPGFQITNLTVTGSPVTSVGFSFNSTTGTSYTVQGSVDLTTWITVGTPTGAAGSTTPFNVDLGGFPALSGQQKVFFRVVGP